MYKNAIDITNLFEFLRKPIAGIYILHQGNKVVYVGRSINVESRVAKHWRGAGANGKGILSKSRDLAGNFDKVQFVEVSDLFLQTVLEAFYIWKYNPSYNVHGRYPIPKDHSDEEAWKLISKMANQTSRYKRLRRSL